jgi:farnesyl-diphosphate farnesyltransferase
MVFYLILRGLDTVEDDMTIPIAKKDKILREFHNYLDIPGWTFTESIHQSS